MSRILAWLSGARCSLRGRICLPQVLFVVMVLALALLQPVMA